MNQSRPWDLIPYCYEQPDQSKRQRIPAEITKALVQAIESGTPASCEDFQARVAEIIKHEREQQALRNQLKNFEEAADPAFVNMMNRLFGVG